MRRLYALSLIIIAFLCFSNTVKAQIATFSFTGSSGDEATFAADAQPTNATVNKMERGTGTAVITLANGFNAKDWSTSGIDLTDYYEFTVTPYAGYTISLTSVVLDERYAVIGSNDSYNYTLRSSLDGFATDINTPKTVNALASGTAGTTTTGNSFDLSGGTFDGISSPVTFRLYAYSLENGSMEWGIDNVVINGTVNSPSKSILGSLDFESVNYTLSTPTSPDNNSFFNVYDESDHGTGHSFENGPLKGVQGTKYLGYRDGNTVGTNNAKNATTFDVSSYESLEVDFSLAATSGVNYEDVDYLLLEYDFDGNGFQSLTQWSGTSSVALATEDADFTGGGDGVTATELGTTFKSFVRSIPKEGKLLTIRFTTLTSVEDFAVDNVAVLGSSDATSPTASAPTNVAQTLKGGTTSTSTVQSTEYGNIYLFLASETAPTTQTEINTLVSANKAFLGKADAVSGTPYTVTPLSTLIDGVYNIVSVDYAGNVSTAVAGWLTVDNTKPTVDIQNEPANVNNTSAFNITIQFSEDVTGFIEGDITVGNGSTSNFVAVDGNTYTVDITPSGTGDITIDIAADVALDAANNGNTVATQATITFDNTQPSVDIQNEPATRNTTAFNVTFEFSEDVTEFVIGDITVGNGAASNFVAVDGNTYTADITGDGVGNITIDVAAGVAQDAATNNNTAATQAIVILDVTPPTVDIQNEPATRNTSAFNVTFEFSEDVTGFVIGDIIVGNGAASNFVAVDGNTYTADITGDGVGNITIDVAAGVAQDAATNNNTAATQAIVILDVTPPTVDIQNEPATRNTSAFNVTFEFSEDVTGFVIGDITVGNGAASNFVAVDGNTYSADITGDGVGNITIDVAAGVAQDAATNNNTAATQAVVTLDVTAPTVDIQNEPATRNTSAFNVSFEFSEDVTGFVIGDITVGNGAVSNFVAVDGNTYTADITPSGAGNITIDVAANVATDAAGNDNTAATQAVIIFDNIQPTVDIQNEPATRNTSAFNVTFEFSENVTGFVIGDITVGNGSASNFVAVDGNTYTADITGNGVGDITIDVAGSVAQDAATNNNTAATQAVIILDITSPTVDIQNEPTIVNSTTAFNVTFEFSENVSGFVIGDITVGNGSASNFIAVDGNTYTADITPNGGGDITIDVTAGVAQDAATNNNTAATQAVISYDIIAPAVNIQNAPTKRNTTPFNVTFEFSEDVTGFVIGDITVGNGSASNFVAVDGNTYTADITGNGVGNITIDVGAGVAQDAATNNNTAATQVIVTFDNTSPQATVTVSDGTIYTGDLVQVVTVTYDEDMDTGTTPTISIAGNFTAGSGSWSNATTYTNTFTHNGTSEEIASVSVSMTAGGASDIAGNSDLADATLPSFQIDTKRPSFVVVQYFPNSGVSNSNRDVMRAEVSEEITLDGTTSPFPALTISNNDEFTSAGFRVTVDGVFKDFVTGSANSGDYDNSYNVYQNDGVTRNDIPNNRSLRFEGSNNGQWDGIENPRLSYIQGGGIFDLAGNEMATVIDVLSSDGDITPPTISGNVVLYPNGDQPETLVFTVSEILNILEGGTVIGFGTSTGSISTAVYTGAETTRTITLTSSADGQWDNTVTLSYTSDGTTTNVKDVSGNEMVNFTGQTVIYENIPPTITALSIASSNTTPTLVKGGETVTVTFTADDGLDLSSLNLSDIRSGGNLVANNGAITYAATTNLFEYSAQFTVSSADTDGTVTFKLDYSDVAGNTGTQVNQTNITDASSVTVDNTIPVVQSIVKASTDVTTSTSVDFTVTFSEDVSGVDVTDFSITHTNLTGGTISVVTPVSGTVYTVTVSSINLSDDFYSGTLRLDFISDATVKDNVGLSTTANFTTGETYTIIHPEPAEDITVFEVHEVTTTTITVKWVESEVDQLPNRHLVLAKKSTGTFTTIADGTFINDGVQVAGDIAANIIRGDTIHTFIGLESGTAYDFIIYPHTNDGTNVNYKTTTPSTVSGATTTASVSTLVAGTGTEPVSISSLINTNETAIANLDFTITDDGTAPGDDNAPMTISEIIITQNATNNEIADWTTTIAGAVLTDGVDSIAGTVNATNITFTGIPSSDEKLGEIDDDESKIFTLKIWLVTTLPAGSDLKQFDFEVLSENISYANASASSKLAASQAVNSGVGNNKIDVLATAYNILQQPPATITAGKDMVPIVQLEAVDIHGNRDLNYAVNPGITNASGFSMSATAITDVANGVLTFPTTFKYTDSPGDGTLTITDGVTPSITITTSAVDVDASLIFTQNTGGVAADPITSGATNQALLGFEVDAIGTSSITAIDISTNGIAASGKIFNVRLVESIDATFSSDDLLAGVLGTYTITGDPLTLSGLSISMSNTTPTRYLFIVADIEENVNGFTTDDLQLSVTEANITTSIDTDIDPFTINGTLYSFLDTIKPDATDLVPDIALIADSDAGNLLSFTITFNENMDRTVAPTVTFPTALEDPTTGGTLTLDASSIWQDQTTYIAKFLITDKNLDMANIDVQVTAAQDTTGNIMNSATFADEFSIDMANTTASGATANSGNPAAASLIVDATTGNGTFTITVTFPESMIVLGFDPTITFPTVGEDPSATLTFASDSWSDAKTYVATYDVADGNETINNIDVHIAGARDLATNLMDPTTIPDVFSIDNENASVVSITPNFTTVSDSETGLATFSLTIVYDENMDVSTTPTIAFPVEDPTSSLAQSGTSGWSDALTYIAVYDVTDNDLLLNDIDVNVSGANDANNNLEQGTTIADVFDIDLENPTATGVTVSHTTIYDSDNGVTFTVTVDFSELMDGTVNPTISFPIENPLNTITLTGGIWNTTTQFIASYSIADVNETIDLIDIQVTVAQDIFGNVMYTGDFADQFNIDTENPNVVSVTPSTTLINGNPENVINDSETGTGTFTLTVVFDEDMDQSAGLTSGDQFLSFPTAGENPVLNTLTYNSSFWTNSTTYVVTYDVADANELLENIDVQVTGAPDVIGNILNSSVAADNFIVHMDNAYVTSITPSHNIVGDPIEGSQTFSLAIEFNEPMVSTVDPTIDFPTALEDPTSPLANITQNGGSWNVAGTIYTALYNVDGSHDQTINDIDVRVRFAIDSLANNMQQESIITDVFDLNTQNPKITDVSSPDPDGYYRAGEIITINVTLDQDVTVITTGGTPKLGLNTNDSAVFISNVTPNILVFEYLILPNQNSADLDYNAINSLVLNGATIRDLADNDAVLDLPSPGGLGSLANNKNIVVDSEDPTLSDTAPFLPAADTFAVPVTADLVLNFKENIAFTTDPTLNIYVANIDSSFVRTYNVLASNGGILSIVGNTLTINDTLDFSESSLYKVGIDSAAIEDLAGNAYAGFTLANSQYSFQTFGTPVITGIQQNSGGVTTAVCVDSLITIQGRFFRGYSNFSNISTVTFHYPNNSASVNADIGTLNVISDTEFKVKVPSGLDTTGFRISIAVNADNAAIGTSPNPTRTSLISTVGALVGPYAADLIAGTTNLTNAVCSEGQVTTTLAVNILGGNGNYNFVYQVNGTDDTTVPGYLNGTDFTIDPPNSNNNNYSLFRIRDLNNCPVPSAGIDPTAITIVEHTQPKIESISDLAGLCLEFSPTSVDLEATISGSTNTATWTVQNGGGTFQSTGNNNAGYDISVNDTTEIYNFVSSDFQLDTLRIRLSLTNIPYPCAPTESVVNITYTNDRVANLKGNKSVCKLTTEDPALDFNASIAGDATYGIWEAFLPDGVTPATGIFSKGDSVAVVTATGSITNKYTFSSADKNQPYLLLTLTPGGGSCGDSIANTVSINVKDLPNPSNSFTLRNSGVNDTIVCAGDQLKKYELYEGISAPTGSTFKWLISDPLSGAFESENTTKSVFINWANATDTTSLKVTEKNSDGCTSDTVFIPVMVNKVPQPDFNEPVGSTFGEDGSKVKLGGIPSGGIFSGKSVSLVTNDIGETFYAFDPSTAKEGTHKITYTSTNIFGCSSSTDRDFTVFKLSASIIDTVENSPLISEYCIDYGDIVISLAETTKSFFKAEGITFIEFSGPGIRHVNDTIAIFNPDSAFAQAQSASVTLAISVDNKGTLQDIGNQIIIINPKPVLAFNPLNSFYCNNESSIQLTRNQTRNPEETFKFFIKEGDVGALSANYIFDPSKVDFSTIGYDSSNFIIAYAYQDAKGCNDTTTFKTSIFKRPPAPAVTSVAICQDESLKAFEITNRVNNSVQNSLISWRNASNVEVGNDIIFQPSIDNKLTSSNSFSVTQEINRCTSPIVNLTYEVLAKPVVTLSGFTSINANICVDALPVEITASSTGSISEFKGDTTGFVFMNGTRFFNPFTAADSTLLYDQPVIDTIIYRSLINYSNRTCRDSIIQIVDVITKPVVKIDPLDTTFCPTDARLELTGNQPNGQFVQSSGVDFENEKYYFSPSLNLAGNRHKIKYIYTDNFGCSNSDSTEMRVYNLPKPDFVWQAHPTFRDSTACAGETIYFIDRSVDTIPGEQPVNWYWDFKDATGLHWGQTSSEKNPEYTFPIDATNRNVQLVVTSEQGCVKDITKNITIYKIPTGSFSFENICSNESTKFQALNLPTDPLENITWTFVDEKLDNLTILDSVLTRTSDFTNIVEHQFLLDTGYQTVKMDVLSKAGCLHTFISNNVFTLPVVTVTEAKNFNFETSDEGWLPVGNRSIWQHGLPNGFNLKNLEDSVWMTGLDTTSYPSQIRNGYLYSACFNFEELDRPMVSFDLYYDLQKNIDGVVLQWASSGKDSNWNDQNPNINMRLGDVLGRYDQGDNWYNVSESEAINSQPGGQDRTGWSGNSSGWTSAKLALSDIPADKRKSVVFRFAFASGSVSADKQLDGVAIDNFFLGERTRTVLFEHFTNIDALNTNSNARADQLSFNSYEDNDGVEVVKLAYHTGFPGNDVLNKDNSGEVGARVLYYNIKSIPTTVMDGIFNTYSNAITTPNAYAPFNSWVPNQFSRRTLQAATVDIETTITVENPNININTSITPKIDIQKDSLVVQVAVVEKGIAFAKDLGMTTLPPGVDSSTFVMKKLLPNPLGSKFKPGMGSTFSLSFDWKPEDHKVYDLNDLAVVVFVQDELFQIYQSNIVYDIDGSSISITGTDEDEINITPLVLFPVPASKEITLSYSKGWEKDQMVKVFDQSGRIIMFGNWNANQTEMTLETVKLADGMYFVQVEDPDIGIRTRKKFMVIHK